MSTTRKYTTLRGLFQNLGLRNLTLASFISKRAYDNVRHEWVVLQLSDDLADEIAVLLASVLVSKRYVDKYATLIHNAYTTYGIYSRLWITRTKNGFRAEYCAGQDYPAEIRCIQSLLRR